MDYLEKVRQQILEISSNLRPGKITLVTIELNAIEEELPDEKSLQSFLTFVTSSAPITKLGKLKKLISSLPCATLLNYGNHYAIVRVSR